MKINSIETYLRFIAESIEWQNKLLAAVYLDKDTDNSGDESKCGDDKSCLQVPTAD